MRVYLFFRQEKIKKILTKLMQYNIIILLLRYSNVSGSGSVVEHRLAKARVASSNLVFRSILFFVEICPSVAAGFFIF